LEDKPRKQNARNVLRNNPEHALIANEISLTESSNSKLSAAEPSDSSGDENKQKDVKEVDS